MTDLSSALFICNNVMIMKSKSLREKTKTFSTIFLLSDQKDVLIVLVVMVSKTTILCKIY